MALGFWKKVTLINVYSRRFETSVGRKRTETSQTQQTKWLCGVLWFSTRSHARSLALTHYIIKRNLMFKNSKDERAVADRWIVVIMRVRDTSVHFNSWNCFCHWWFGRAFIVNRITVTSFGLGPLGYHKRLRQANQPNDHDKWWKMRRKHKQNKHGAHGSIETGQRQINFYSRRNVNVNMFAMSLIKFT